MGVDKGLAPRTVAARGLTARQRAVYEFIYSHARDFGYQPSFREVMNHFGFKSPQAVNSHMLPVSKLGYIAPVKPRGEGATSRSIRFLLKPDGTPFTGFAEKG